MGYGTIRNLASVARKIETSRRREVLSWDHHAAVASLASATGDELLARAEAGGWSRERMREEARAAGELECLKSENARLRRDLAKASSRAADEAGQLRLRSRAEHRVVRDAIARVAVMAEALAQSPALGDAHGNNRRGMARALRRTADGMAADINTALARIEAAAARIEGRQYGETAA